jgi:acylphosphatase
MHTRLQARIDGRVQGVGFRYFVLECATQLELSGGVRNVQDGTVEVIAEGPREALERLLVLLHQGPRSAYVTEIKTAWEPATGEFQRFEVWPTAWFK